METMKTVPAFLEKLGHFLLGIADLFELWIPKLREFAREAFALAKSLINPAMVTP
jgi:hypothetical protein